MLVLQHTQQDPRPCRSLIAQLLQPETYNSNQVNQVLQRDRMILKSQTPSPPQDSPGYSSGGLYTQ